MVASSKENNAYATLGGNIILTRELINSMSSENALSMVLAHEIAHIKHRDPIRSAGSQVFLYAMFSILGSVGDTNSFTSLTSVTGRYLFRAGQKSNADN